jgi:hypothetical protein
MAARDGAEVVDAVGEADSPDEQVQLICAPLVAALGQAPPAPIEGVNVHADLLASTLAHTAAYLRDTIAAAMGRLGLQPRRPKSPSRPRDPTSPRWRSSPWRTTASTTACTRGC